VPAITNLVPESAEKYIYTGSEKNWTSVQQPTERTIERIGDEKENSGIGNNFAGTFVRKCCTPEFPNAEPEA
jgi:hypothetical protein